MDCGYEATSGLFPGGLSSDTKQKSQWAEWGLYSCTARAMGRILVNFPRNVPQVPPPWTFWHCFLFLLGWELSSTTARLVPCGIDILPGADSGRALGAGASEVPDTGCFGGKHWGQAPGLKFVFFTVWATLNKFFWSGLVGLTNLSWSLHSNRRRASLHFPWSFGPKHQNASGN